LNRITLVRRGFVALALVSLVSLALVACGDDDDDDGDSNGGDHSTGSATIGDIAIEGAYARESVTDVAAVYMTIKNSGAADTLLSVSADVGSEAQLHEVVDSSMRQMEGGIPIPENGEVTLKTGGLHVMILGIEGGLKADSTEVHLTLTFENAGSVELTAPVQALNGDGEMDHDMDDDKE